MPHYTVEKYSAYALSYTVISSVYPPSSHHHKPLFSSSLQCTFSLSLTVQTITDLWNRKCNIQPQRVSLYVLGTGDVTTCIKATVFFFCQHSYTQGHTGTSTIRKSQKSQSAQTFKSWEPIIQHIPSPFKNLSNFHLNLSIQVALTIQSLVLFNHYFIYSLSSLWGRWRIK